MGEIHKKRRDIIESNKRRYRKLDKLRQFFEKEKIAGLVFVAPWLIGFLVFTAFPILCSLFLSFTEYDMMSAPVFIGFRNFIKMFTKDPKFWKCFGVTLYLVAVAIPLRLVVSLLVAMLLTKPHKGLGIYRSAAYIPSLIGGSVAVAVIWRQLFSPTGLVNDILKLIHLPSDTNWLGNKDTAIWTIIILMAWQFGSSMLIFIAGLKNIPQMYYEAASVDGAGPLKKFFCITLPSLSPIILFNLIMQTISGFMVFTPSYIITNGGPLDSTRVYAMYLFQRGFDFYEMGYASAMAWFMLIIISVVTCLILKSSNKWVFYENKGEF